MLFRYFVLEVIMYGAEVWNWKEREELKRIQIRYIKLDLDSCTPDYVVYKETNVEWIGAWAGCKAVKLEEKAIKEDNRKVVECIKEKERAGYDETFKERKREIL